MGEEVALVDPLRRKSAAGFGSFLGEKSVPAKEVCDEPTRLRETESKRQCGTGTSEVQCENGKMRTVFKKSTCSSENKSLQLIKIEYGLCFMLVQMPSLLPTSAVINYPCFFSLFAETALEILQTCQPLWK